MNRINSNLISVTDCVFLFPYYTTVTGNMQQEELSGFFRFGPAHWPALDEIKPQYRHCLQLYAV